MSIKKVIGSFAAYNLSANQQFVKWLSNHSEVQLPYRVLKTLNHIWAIEEIWCADLFKNQDFVDRYGVENLEPQEVFEELFTRSEIITKKVSELTEEELSDV